MVDCSDCGMVTLINHRCVVVLVFNSMRCDGTLVANSVASTYEPSWLPMGYCYPPAGSDIVRALYVTLGIAALNVCVLESSQGQNQDLDTFM